MRNGSTLHPQNRGILHRWSFEKCLLSPQKRQYGQRLRRSRRTHSFVFDAVFRPPGRGLGIKLDAKTVTSVAKVCLLSVHLRQKGYPDPRKPLSPRRVYPRKGRPFRRKSGKQVASQNFPPVG